MVYHGDKILVQNRVKKDWQGITFPGGHVEKAESFVQAVIREIYEETGLTIKNPVLCGTKQFQTEDEERYIVLLYRTNQFEGDLRSSEEGEMLWIDKNQLGKYQVAEGFLELFQVFDTDQYSEFYFERDEDNWIIRLY
jgi:8-oxo-dGTP diphosphatase